MTKEQTSLNKIILGVIPSSYGRISTIVFGLCCVLIYTRVLPIEEYGNFILFQVVLGLLATITEFGLSDTITKFVTSSENDVEREEVINTLLIFQVITLLVFALLTYAGFLLLENYSNAGQNNNFAFFSFIPVLLVIEGLYGAFSSVLSGLMKFRFLGLSEFVMSFTSLVITYVLIVYFRQGAMGAIYARLISRIVVLVISFFKIKSHLKFVFNYMTLTKMLQFGTPLYINQLLNIGSTRLDVVIINQYLGVGQIAIYETGKIIPDSLEQLFDAFRRVLYPILSKQYSLNNDVEVADILNNSLRIVAFLGATMTLFMFLFGGDIVKLVFSEKYYNSISITIAFMVLLLFNIITYTLGYSLVATGESNKTPFVNIIRTACIIPMYFISIPFYGVYGAVFSKLFGVSVANPLNVHFLRMKGVDVKVMNYVKPVIIVLVYILVFSFFTLSQPYLKVIIFITFIIVNLLFSTITSKDITYLYHELRKS